MKKVLMSYGEICEVSESYGRRLIEQGKAVPAPEEKAEKAPEEKKPEADKPETEGPAEKPETRKARKK